MKLKGCLVWVVVALSVALAGSPALALDPIPSKSGFSGYVQPGLGLSEHQEQHGGQGAELRSVG